MNLVPQGQALTTSVLGEDTMEEKAENPKG
jgi:hypothetical protein